MTELSKGQVAAIKAIVSEWDFDESIRRAIEELAELQVALLHYRRGRSTTLPVLSEMADVHIALKHLELLLGGYERQLDDKLRKHLPEPFMMRERFNR